MNANTYFVIDLVLAIFLSATRPSAVFLGSKTVLCGERDSTERLKVSNPACTVSAPCAELGSSFPRYTLMSRFENSFSNFFVPPRIYQ